MTEQTPLTIHHGPFTGRQEPFERRYGAPLDALSGAEFNPHAGGDLRAAAHDLGMSVFEVGLSRSERLSRAERAAEAAELAQRARWAPNPYADGSPHARLSDLLASVGAPGSPTGRDSAAADRLALARAYDQLAAQTRAIGDMDGLIGHSTAAPIPYPDTDTPLVDVLARPVTTTGPTAEHPGPWTDVPAAVIGWDVEQLPATSPTLALIDAPFTVSRYATAASPALYAWSAVFAREQEAMWGHVVKVGLEKELAAALTAAATPAASLTAAESAIGAAWAPGIDVVVCAGTDLPKVKRAYARVYPDPADRPALHPTIGLDGGTILLMASPGVTIEATPLEWMIATAPAYLGRELSAHIQGRALLRLPGTLHTMPTSALEAQP